MEKAYEAVMKHTLGVRRAADEYCVPRSTLQDHVSGKVPFGCKSGPRRYLNTVEELKLVSFIKGCSSIGYSRTRKQVIGIVQNVVDKKDIKVTVSESWWKSFQRRHKDLVLREPEGLSHARMMGASNDILENYFDLLEKTILEENLKDCPCQLFNLDESGFPLNPNPPKVISAKGEKHPSCVTGHDKSQITVLSCVSAGGYAIPPLVIFDRKTLKPELTEGEVPGTMYGLSDSGWMDSESWFDHHFLVYAPPARPLLLLMDGHSSHFSPNFINKAAEEHVIVFCLPPNSTHRTQPLDKGVFGPLKRKWREECYSYMQSNPGKIITRYQFSAIFGQAWAKSVTPSNITSGFRVTGIFPTDRYKLIPKHPSELHAYVPSLCKRTGLKFIPLFTRMSISPTTHQSHSSRVCDKNVYASPIVTSR